jgi:hypothetical protein
MRSKEEALELFRHKKLDPDLDQDRLQRLDAVDVVFQGAVSQLWDLLPDGAGKTHALRKLQTAMMSANSCITNDGK